MSDKSISIPLPEWNASVLLESVTTMLYQWLDYLFIYLHFIHSGGNHTPALSKLLHL